MRGTLPPVGVASVSVAAVFWALMPGRRLAVPIIVCKQVALELLRRVSDADEAGGWCAE